MINILQIYRTMRNQFSMPLDNLYFKSSLEAKDALHKVGEPDDIEIRMLLDSDKRIDAWNLYHKEPFLNTFNLTERVKAFTLKRATNLSVRQPSKQKSFLGCSRPDCRMKTQYYYEKPEKRGPSCSVLEMKLSEYPFEISKSKTEGLSRFYTTNAVSTNKFRSKVVKGNALSKISKPGTSSQHIIKRKRPKLKRTTDPLRINTSAFCRNSKLQTESQH